MPEEEQWAFSEDVLCDISHIHDGEGGAPDGCSCVLGEFLMIVHSDDAGETSEMIDLAEAMSKVGKLREKFGATTEIKLWKGTMMT
jgi:hypothetical protein